MNPETVLTTPDRKTWEERYGEVRAALVAAPYGHDPADVAVTALFGPCPDVPRTFPAPQPSYAEVLRSVEATFGEQAVAALLAGEEA
jgi:hypothetical protein